MKQTLLLLISLFTSSLCFSQVTLSYNQIQTGFSIPVDIANADDGSNRLFIVEKSGRIKIVENGTVLSTPFINLDPRVNSGASERGLLGLAFHPDYKNNGYFFVNYINNSGTTTIARYEVSAGNVNVADYNSEQILMTISQPYSNHNAGALNFSPIDGYLYIGMGDGGSGGDPGCRSQDSTSLLGKMLRIDVDQNVGGNHYGVPVDNPYVGNSTIPDEIWAFGLRNPWKFSFDTNGDMWIADVGQNVMEEVNFQPASSTGGENYGWAIMEGTQCYDSHPINTNCNMPLDSCFDATYTDPIFNYFQNANPGGYSITGGYVYRGCKYAELYGYYLVTDYISSSTWVINSGGIATQVANTPGGVTSFGVDEKGEMYLLTWSGSLYEIRETTHPEVLTLTITESPLSGTYQAADSIIIESDVAISSSSLVRLIAPNLVIADEVNLPLSTIIRVDKGPCDD